MTKEELDKYFARKAVKAADFNRGMEARRSHHLGSILSWDPAQVSDWSAWAILQRTGSAKIVLRHLERTRGMDYPTQVGKTIELFHKRPFSDDPNRLAVLDATGLGRPILDLARREGLPAWGLTITGGGEASWDQKRAEVSVPKSELITFLQIAMSSGELVVPKSLPLAPAFVDELQNFRVKISEDTRRASFSAREGEHDDLILAVAVGLFVLQRRPIKPRLMLVRGAGR